MTSAPPTSEDWPEASLTQRRVDAYMARLKSRETVVPPDDRVDDDPS